MNDFIPVNTPLLSGNEEKYLLDCVRTGWISSEGPYIKKFEEMMAEKTNRKYGAAVANGTAAIDIAIEALGIGQGDEVIVPSFTIISCISHIVRVGAIPVVVDSDPITWNMRVDLIEEKITPKTKLIMAVHIYGLPVDMDPLLALAKKYNLKVLEDAAQMHGQTYNGAPCGSFGDVSTFSFYPNKQITTGEGGMVLTNSSELNEEFKSLRNLCFQTKRFIHEKIGWNYRMTNMQAALGVAQVERLDEIVKMKRGNGLKYYELLNGLGGVQLPLLETKYAKNIFWVFGLLLADDHKLDGAEVMQKLALKGIGCRPFFYPIHQQPVLSKMGMFKGETYPVAERLYKKGFYIPSGLGLKDQDIERVAIAVKEVLG